MRQAAAVADEQTKTSHARLTDAKKKDANQRMSFTAHDVIPKRLKSVQSEQPALSG